MKFLSKDNFQLIIEILNYHKKLTKSEQGIVYHIMKFVNEQKNQTILEKNKTTIKLFYSQQKHEENPLKYLNLPDEISKSYFSDFHNQRNNKDIQINNENSTSEFKKVYNESLNFMEYIRNLPIDNRNKKIIIPETEEIQYLKQTLYNSIEDTIFLSIDSRDRNYTEPVYNMHIDLNKTIKQIYSIELIQLDIPKIQYLINENNNILHFQESTNLVLQAIIPIGNYTINELLLQIQNILNNIGSSTYNVSLINEKINISSDLTGGDNIFNLIFNDHETQASIGTILGFDHNNKLGSNNYTAIKPYNLNGDNVVYLHLPNIEIHNPFGMIHLNVNQGETVFFQSDYIIRHLFPQPINLNHLHIELRNYNNNFYRTTGEWSFLLKINFLK